MGPKCPVTQDTNPRKKIDSSHFFLKKLEIFGHFWLIREKVKKVDFFEKSHFWSPAHPRYPVWSGRFDVFFGRVLKCGSESSLKSGFHTLVFGWWVIQSGPTEILTLTLTLYNIIRLDVHNDPNPFPQRSRHHLGSPGLFSVILLSSPQSLSVRPPGSGGYA